jgi:hypothetical protein
MNPGDKALCDPAVQQQGLARDDCFTPGSKGWWTVRRVANGDARRPWYELTDDDLAALGSTGERP